MADAQDSKSCGGDLVWVQVPPSAVAKKPCIDRAFVVSKEFFQDMERLFLYVLTLEAGFYAIISYNTIGHLQDDVN